MLPLGEAGTSSTGHDADVHAGRPDIDLDRAAELASGWDLVALSSAVDGPGARDLSPGDRWRVDDADVVSCAPELARLTLNLAAVHHDRRATGRRLVNGGHTVGLAATQVSRVLPAIAAIVAWRACNHTAPVYEDDALTSEVEVDEVALRASGGALVQLHSLVSAHRPDQQPTLVLDWRYVAVVA